MGSAASAGKEERHKEGSKTEGARMPEVEKQSAVASEGSGESLEKPGGLAFEVVLEDAKIKEAENRRKSMEASTLEKLAQEEKKREEVRAKKASVSEPEEKEEEEEKKQESA